MTRILKLFAVVFLLCSCNKSNEPQTSPLTIKTDDGNVVYNVETATTDEELKKGLMYRDSLGADHGMIFDLSHHQSQMIAMWMKNTKIPLDMLFINPDGVIYWIKENAQPMTEDLIVPPVAAQAVVEINANEIAKHNIKVGQKIEHILFNGKEEIENKADVSTEETETESAKEDVVSSSQEAE